MSLFKMKCSGCGQEFEGPTRWGVGCRWGDHIETCPPVLARHAEKYGHLTDEQIRARLLEQVEKHIEQYGVKR